jgi:serine/threonine protein phosphatase PrpC
VKFFHAISYILLFNLIIKTQLLAMDLPSEQQFIFSCGAATADGELLREYNLCKSCSKPRLELRKKPNEDRYILCELEDSNGPITLAAIFDGHNGGNVAQDLSDNFCTILQECAEGKTILDKSVVNRAFELADARVKWMQEEGSSALVVIMQGKNLLIAHAGDSRAVICACEAGYLYIKQTKDHRITGLYEDENTTPKTHCVAGNTCLVKSTTNLSLSPSSSDLLANDKKDKKTIKFYKGRSLSTEGIILRRRSSKRKEACSEDKRTSQLKGAKNLSRSIGDYCTHGKKNAGIICAPEFLERTIDKNYKFIILASRGVWDAFSAAPDAPVLGVREVLSYAGPQEAAEKLIEVAKKIQPSHLHDDMTVVIIKIN